jgi:hypothetical protein
MSSRKQSSEIYLKETVDNIHLFVNISSVMKNLTTQLIRRTRRSQPQGLVFWVA